MLVKVFHIRKLLPDPPRHRLGGYKALSERELVPAGPVRIVRRTTERPDFGELVRLTGAGENGSGTTNARTNIQQLGKDASRRPEIHFRAVCRLTQEQLRRPTRNIRIRSAVIRYSLR